MDEMLVYTDTRPRAKGAGHAFGFEGNLGFPVVVSAMVSVLFLTVLFGGGSRLPLVMRFVAGLAPLVLTTGYIVLLRSRRPPRYDVDLLRTLVNGPAFQSARVQPVHPYLHQNPHPHLRP
jgi:hypothetical protein